MGSRELAVWSHCASTNKTEPLPTSVRLETPGRMVTELVRLCKSIINGSRGLDTPRTYTWALVAALTEGILKPATAAAKITIKLID
ncbi:MAG TPA: hypothetical protein VE177_03395 [Candidatus Binatus sp.]|nr:hypothetical protein [Candidatus Binatus sp.]